MAESELCVERNLLEKERVVVSDWVSVLSIKSANYMQKAKPLVAKTGPPDAAVP
jgi:hypothetical protein